MVVLSRRRRATAPLALLLALLLDHAATPRDDVGGTAVGRWMCEAALQHATLGVARKHAPDGVQVLLSELPLVGQAVRRWLRLERVHRLIRHVAGRQVNQGVGEVSAGESRVRAVELGKGLGEEGGPEDLAVAGAAKARPPIGAARHHRVDRHRLPRAMLEEAQREDAAVDQIRRGKDVDKQFGTGGDESEGTG